MDKFWYLMGAIDFVAYNVSTHPSLEAFEIRYLAIVGPFTGSHALEKPEWKEYYKGWADSMIIHAQGQNIDFPY